MANVAPKGILEHIDIPSQSIIAAAAATGATGTMWVSDATGSATDFVAAVAAGKGLHYFGVMDAVDNSLLEFAGNWLQFTAQEGHCYIETMIQFEDASEHAFCFGFNDTVEDGNLTVDYATDTLTPTATAFCGFVYDGTDASDNNLVCYWVSAAVSGQTDATGKATSAGGGSEYVKMKGIAPTDAKWLYMRVELQDTGSGYYPIATFTATDHTGKSATKEFKTNLTRSTPLCWHLSIENRTATGGDVFLRNCNWAQTIPDM